MPIDRYYDGNGNAMMDRLVSEYGPEKGKRVFYAMARKRKNAGDANAEPPKKKFYGEK